MIVYFPYATVENTEHYKINKPTLVSYTAPGIEPAPDRLPVVGPAGSVIRIVNREGKFVEVDWDERRVFMFAADVDERAALLSGSAR